jgi:hypothetical protein
MANGYHGFMVVVVWSGLVMDSWLWTCGLWLSGLTKTLYRLVDVNQCFIHYVLYS